MQSCVFFFCFPENVENYFAKFFAASEPGSGWVFCLLARNQQLSEMIEKNSLVGSTYLWLGFSLCDFFSQSVISWCACVGESTVFNMKTNTSRLWPRNLHWMSALECHVMGIMKITCDAVILIRLFVLYLGDLDLLRWNFLVRSLTMFIHLGPIFFLLVGGIATLCGE